MSDRRKRRSRTPRITMPQNDDLSITGRKLRRQNGRIVSLSAAVRKERFFQIARGDLGQFLGQIALRPVCVERRGVGDGIDLGFPRRVDARIGVAEASIKITNGVVNKNTESTSFEKMPTPEQHEYSKQMGAR